MTFIRNQKITHGKGATHSFYSNPLELGLNLNFYKTSLKQDNASRNAPL